MKDLPVKFEAQNERRDAYEAPAIIHEGTISTRAQSEPPPNGDQTSIPVDDLLSM